MHEQLPAPYHVNTWFFVCGPLAVNVFIMGLATNLYVFKRYNLAFDRVLDMQPDEVPTARGVFRTGLLLLFVQFLLFHIEVARRGDKFGVDEIRMEMILLGYVLVAAVLLLCPFDVLHYKFRMFVVRKVAHCLWPFQDYSLKIPTHATPFVEVFIADGMTSLSKFIQDLSIALMLLLMSSYNKPEDLKESYISKLKDSPLPYFAASTPYIIRATQCMISFRRTVSVDDRFLHLLNTMKYCSSLLVISVGAYPMLMGLARPKQNSFFLLCAVFNSLYSFIWDVVMDWGLGQPKLPRRIFFLRHQLTYRPQKIYYLIIVVDFALRIMWVTKWWDWMHRGVHFKLFLQIAEVVRRIIWNFVRVEWQCIKLDIIGSKKLSADALELEGMIEKMPLIAEDDLLDDAKTRMRLHSRSNLLSSENSCTKTRKALSPSNGRRLHLPVTKTAHDADIGLEKQAKHDETKLSAAITVASYSGKPQAMLVSGKKITVSTSSRKIRSESKQP
ncbi:unnamed protein product [Peronospora belbahrii]|uniref:EXS domain-containing protein n=1 Tax=Peronospora belbahrii TaxID=622444 RepID=A0AAU9LBB2_9STRA|nr:unnamed protein product [Peronospora belbahrii]CAH0513417.1 unnamed protein product [Peronospora belbahrii]